MSTRAQASDVKNTYVAIELEYCYCNVCGRKDYRVIQVGQLCGGYNTACAKYPEKQCQGTMVKSTQATGTPVTSVGVTETS